MKIPRTPNIGDVYLHITSGYKYKVTGKTPEDIFKVLCLNEGWVGEVPAWFFYGNREKYKYTPAAMENV